MSNFKFLLRFAPLPMHQRCDAWLPTGSGVRQAAGVFAKLAAHGTAVGLPEDADMGNSEVPTAAA